MYNKLITKGGWITLSIFLSGLQKWSLYLSNAIPNTKFKGIKSHNHLFLLPLWKKIETWEGNESESVMKEETHVEYEKLQIKNCQKYSQIKLGAKGEALKEVKRQPFSFLWFCSYHQTSQWSLEPITSTQLNGTTSKHRNWKKKLYFILIHTNCYTLNQTHSHI